MSEWSGQSASSEPVVPGPAPVGVSAGSDAGGPPVLVDYPVGDHGEPPPGGGRHGRRPRRAVAAVVGVLALLATGLAVTQLAAADGAENPEAAVRALFDAIDDEDPVGVLESLSPSERDLLVPSIEKLAGQLARVEVIGDVDLRKVGGVDLKVQDLELRTQGLHPDVAAVKVSGGTIEASAKLRDLPLGTALLGAMEDEGGQDLDGRLNGSTPIDLTLVTVKSGDGWHVSLLYTLAEADRDDSGAPVPDFGNGIPAKGADSPEAAVDAMVAALNDRDVTRMIELTPPDSMAVLHDYGPGWIAEQDEDDEERIDDPYGDEDYGDDSYGDEDEDYEDYEDYQETERLEDVRLGEPQGSGDTRRLSLEGYRVISTYDDEETTSFEYDGSCMTTTTTSRFTRVGNAIGSEDGDEAAPLEEPTDETTETETETTKRCPGDVDAGFGFGFGFGFGGLGLLGIFPLAGPLLVSPGEADIVVVERDGKWYVDPARSILDTLALNLGAMTPEQAGAALRSSATTFNGDEDAWYATIPGSEYEETCPDVDPPAEDASFEERKEAGKRCYEQEFEEFDDLGDLDSEDACYDTYEDQEDIDICLDDGYGEPAPETPSPKELCYQASEDVAAIETCLQGLGDPAAVSEYHELQCYGADDSTMVEACLQDLVDRGEIDAEAAADFRCSIVYDQLRETDEVSDATPEDYERCMADAGFGADEEDDGSAASPSSSVPAPTTTR
jgi:hypothetical protein